MRIEEWTYNFGSTRLIRFLRFETGLLRHVSRGPYGLDLAVRPPKGVAARDMGRMGMGRALPD
ncbi:MAG: DUF2845 domain-containing protein [Deltaproteobacteria bacterium]|nr:MAG: DUF2845 domain-containing protein [Deltaproteobacteria bacterium]